MNKNYTDIESLKASLSQSGPTYSHERLQADIASLSQSGSTYSPESLQADLQSLSSTEKIEELKMDTLSKDELATILWALDYRMDGVLHEYYTDEEDIVAQKKLYGQLNAVYLKIYDMWKSKDKL